MMRSETSSGSSFQIKQKAYTYRYDHKERCDRTVRFLVEKMKKEQRCN